MQDNERTKNLRAIGSMICVFGAENALTDTGHHRRDGRGAPKASRARVCHVRTHQHGWLLYQPRSPCPGENMIDTPEFHIDL